MYMGGYGDRSCAQLRKGVKGQGLGVLGHSLNYNYTRAVYYYYNMTTLPLSLRGGTAAASPERRSMSCMLTYYMTMTTFFLSLCGAARQHFLLPRPKTQDPSLARILVIHTLQLLEFFIIILCTHFHHQPSLPYRIS